MKIKALRAFLLFAALALGAQGVMASPVPADQEIAPPQVDPDRAKAQADRAIARIKSPYCPGLMLEVCPSPQAGDLRDSIQANANRGLAGDSIVELVLAQVGEEYRAFPRTRGKELLAWVVPPLAIILGLLIVGLVLRRMIPAHPDTAAVVSDEDEARVREAMEAMEREEAADPWETVGPTNR